MFPIVGQSPYSYSHMDKLLILNKQTAKGQDRSRLFLVKQSPNPKDGSASLAVMVRDREQEQKEGIKSKTSTE